MFSSGCGAGSAAPAGTPKATAVAAQATAWQAPTPTPTPKPTTPSPSPRPSGPSARQLVAAAAGPLVKADNDNAGVAVDDLTTGQWASYDGNQEFITASIVKADILATLLYEAQRDHGSLSAEQQSLARLMIEDSDNNAATSLWNDAGGEAGVDAANKDFGLLDTTAGYDPKWGITTTSPNDQIRLLRLIFTTPSKLSGASQEYIQTLMRHVTSEQAWGVTAAADAGTTFAVKNGWLPAPKLWAVNSIGYVTHNGHHLLIAVMSHYNYSYGGGISVVEGIAKKAASAITSWRNASQSPRATSSP